MYIHIYYPILLYIILYYKVLSYITIYYLILYYPITLVCNILYLGSATSLAKRAIAVATCEHSINSTAGWPASGQAFK